MVAFYAASENLTYPQAAFRCTISYTTAIEYIALCEVRHYFGQQVAQEIHEFTMQLVDADDPNCMRVLNVATHLGIWHYLSLFIFC